MGAHQHTGNQGTKVGLQSHHSKAGGAHNNSDKKTGQRQKLAMADMINDVQ